MDYLIRLEGVTRIYSQGDIFLEALKDINLSIKPGEFVAIIGASGSGKSTLLNILGCLDRPTKGEFFFDGKATSKLSRDSLALIRNKKIGFVFQNFNLIPKTSAIENIEVPLFYHNSLYSAIKNREKALKLMELVGIKNKEKHHPSQLSGGEQQRVAIARALINNPNLILADEPTGNLDTQRSFEIISLFQKLNLENNITIVMITHEKNLAACASRNIEITDGKIESDRTVTNPINAREEFEKLLKTKQVDN